MRRHRHSPAARRGFTLVELLVAAALTVTVMAIIAVAFQAGMSTLSSLKSAVTLSEQLRTVETAMRNDLTAPHLEDEQGTPVRVSDPRLGTPDFQATAWANSAPPIGAPVVGPSATTPARRGYLSVIQPSAPIQNISPAFALASGYVYNNAF